MAKEYQRTSGGTLQWRDPGAGVQGWNNVERDEESQYPGAPKASPAPSPAPPPPPPPPAPPAAVPAAMAGLQAAGPSGAPAAPTPQVPMPTFTPISAGPAPGSPPLAGGTSSGGGTTIQGQMEPGPGFVESGNGAGALRALGQRRPAEQSMALAGLSKAY